MGAYRRRVDLSPDDSGQAVQLELILLRGLLLGGRFLFALHALALTGWLVHFRLLYAGFFLLVMSLFLSGPFDLVLDMSLFLSGPPLTLFPPAPVGIAGFPEARPEPSCLGFALGFALGAVRARGLPVGFFPAGAFFGGLPRFLPYVPFPCGILLTPFLGGLSTFA